MWADGLSDFDARQLLSKVGKIHLTEMVDTDWVVVASWEKKYMAVEESNARSELPFIH
jgi:hypothetical protein